MEILKGCTGAGRARGGRVNPRSGPEGEPVVSAGRGPREPPPQTEAQDVRPFAAGLQLAVRLPHPIHPEHEARFEKGQRTPAASDAPREPLHRLAGADLEYVTGREKAPAVVDRGVADPEEAARQDAEDVVVVDRHADVGREG